MVDHFYEPSYVTGQAERWRIELASNAPFGIACLWDTWTDPVSTKVVTSFTMLTVNADNHPVMKQFHKPEDEKRTPVILAPHQFETWLGANPTQAQTMMHSGELPDLRAMHRGARR